MKKLLLALALFLAPTFANAACSGIFKAGSVCGSTVAGPPQEVPNASLPLPPLTAGSLFIGNASNVATVTALSQDCTLASTGAITCTKTNNVAFGSLATQSSVTGAQLPSPFTSGTASGNTSKFMTGSGSFTNSHVAAFDASGNIVDGGGAVGNVTATNSPTNHQTATWTNGTTIQGQGPGTTGQAFVSNGASADPSFQSGAWVLLNTLTASNSTTLSDTSSLTATYNEYILVFEALLPATNNTNLELQIHSGGAFKSTGYLTTAYSSTGAAMAFTQPTTYIPITGGSGSGNSAPGLSGEIVVFNPSVTAIHIVSGQTGYWNGTNSVTNNTSGFWNTSAIIDGFQLLYSSGNITSGVVKVYGRL